MKQKHLGSHGLTVSALGLGCMRMSRMAAPLDLTKDAESIATTQSAIEHGINYLDTGDFYGMGHNEALVGQAIIAELIQEGKVRYLGVSEVGAENLRKAHSVHPVTALEIEYSLACRFAEDEILPAARELGIGVVPYRVLGDGLLTGALTAEPANQDPRFTPARLQGENRRHNVAAVAPFLEMARAKGVTPAALALAWVLSRGEDIVPVVSINRRARIAETLAALDVGLSGEELAALDAMLPPGAISGDRYPPALRDISAR